MGVLSGRRFLESQKTKREGLYRGLIIFFCFVSVLTGILFLSEVGNNLDNSFQSVRTGVMVSSVHSNVMNIVKDINI